MPRLLTTHEVAALIGVSPASVRRLEKSGRLPAGVRLSWKCKRWPEPTITTWIEQLREKISE